MSESLFLVVVATSGVMVAACALVYATRLRGQLHKLRRRHCDLLGLLEVQSRKKQALQIATAAPAAVLTVVGTPTTEDPIVHEVQLRLPGDERPLGSLTRATTEMWETAKPLALGKERLRALAGVVEHGPALSIAGATASQELYAVTFTDSTTLRLAVGDAFMQDAQNGGIRAVAIDAGTGRIVEHGSLHELSTLELAGFATAAWTLLTILVGKRYLADISERLEVISMEVQSIRAHLDYEMKGWLSSTISTLRRNLNELQSESVSPFYARALVSDCLKIARESRHRWETLRLSYIQARKNIERVMASHKMSEDGVLESAEAIELLLSRGAALDLATRIRVGCENLQMAIGMSSAEGAEELDRVAIDFQILTKGEGELGRSIKTMIALGDKPVLFGRDEFFAAQLRAMTAADVLVQQEHEGYRHCNRVAKMIRDDYLVKGATTLLIRRDGSGAVPEARLLSQEPQVVTA